MPLIITEQEWNAAEAFFKDNSDESIYHRENSKLTHTFMKFDNEIVAIARKHTDGILGMGGQATVKQAINRQGKLFTVKAERGQTEKGFALLSENDSTILILKKLGIYFGQVFKAIENKSYTTRYVIKEKEIFDTTTADSKRYTLLEYADGISIADFEANEENNLNATTMYLTCLLSAVAVFRLHEKRIIHCDITPGNIIFDWHTFSAKLIDHNFALELPANESTVSLDKARGTPPFVAPEIYKFREYSFESDIFALGTLFQFLGLENLGREMANDDIDHRLPLMNVIAYLVYKIKGYNFELETAAHAAIEDALELVRPHFQRKLSEGTVLSALLEDYLLKEILTEKQKQSIALGCMNVIKSLHDKEQILTMLSPDCFTVKLHKNDLVVEKAPHIRGKSLNGAAVLSLAKCNNPYNFYFAPESHAAGKYSMASNVYSLGQIIRLLGFAPGYMIEKAAHRRPSLSDAIDQFTIKFTPDPILPLYSMLQAKVDFAYDADVERSDSSCTNSTNSNSDVDELSKSLQEKIKL